MCLTVLLPRGGVRDGYFGKECLGWLAKGSPIFVAIGAILVYLAGVR